ncbi:MAG: cytochrome b/b6 domain-containing protein [Nitrospinae bacterium]|nr:cytochrome b/b6 domain-containing protein [Nitrospinota bacterium]
MRATVTRFTPSERWFHNTVMVTFVFLLVTGLAMLYFNLVGERGEPRSFLVLAHEVVAILFLAGPVIALLLGARKVWKENYSILTRWSKSDLEWLTKKPLTTFLKNLSMPRDDKFNPGQKAWATVAVSGTALLAASGIYMWIYESPILALFIHTAVAIGMVVALSGHVFMALINPATREGIGSIIDGEVDAEWAMEHHPLWMERHATERMRDADVGGDAKVKIDGATPHSFPIPGLVRHSGRRRGMESSTIQIQTVDA